VEKLDQLKAVGGPAAFRYKESEDRPAAVKRLRESLSKYYAKATGDEARYAHIPDADKQSVVEKVATIEKWLDDQTARQAERSKSADASFTSAEVVKKREEVTFFCTPIFNKKAPNVAKPSEPVPSANEAQTTSENADPSDDIAASKQEATNATQEAAVGEMDVD